MGSDAQHRDGGCWFVVLPDCGAASAVAGLLAGRACHTVPHPSGRPWLTGCWEGGAGAGPGGVSVVASGDVRLGIAGESSLTADRLAGRVRDVTGRAGVETAVRGAAGDFHVLASLAGRVYARGSLSGSRPLYWTTVEGVTVAADRARTLAWLTGAGVDPAGLAAHLACPGLPFPCDSATPWRGVHAVSPGHALTVDPHGAAHCAPWWQPPGQVPLAEGAPALRDALRAAVALRVRPGQVLAADLSGGLDSTSLCLLAAEAGARLVTATVHWSAPANEDHHHAARAAARLPGIVRTVFEAARLPGHFAGIDAAHEPGDRPSVALRDRAQQQHIAAVLRAHGAQRRLTGHGGDPAVRPPATYVTALVRRRPLTGLSHARGHRAQQRRSLAATARLLLDVRDYPAWLAVSAEALLVGPRGPAHTPGASPGPHGPRGLRGLRDLRGPRERRPQPGRWGPLAALPPWASEQARELAAGLVRAAPPWPPLVPDGGRYAWLGQIQRAGQASVQLADETAAAGLPGFTPFCDDAVLDACLAVRPHEACTPWTYKPLLSEAMRGVLPESVRTRTTKDHCGPEWYAGLRAQQRHFAAWADDSRLVALGLADAEPLRRALLSAGALVSSAAPLELTLGAEAWLRDLAARPVPAHLSSHPRHIGTGTGGGTARPTAYEPGAPT